MTQTNNLYIINEVLYDYTPGMVVIAAPSLDRCREIFEAKFDYWLEEFDVAIDNGYFKIIESVNHAEGVVSYAFGGG